MGSKYPSTLNSNLIYNQMSKNHLCRSSDRTILNNEALTNSSWSLRTELYETRISKVRDIDQTDFHRFEPSSPTLLWDEQSHQ